MSKQRNMPSKNSIYDYWHKLEGRFELEKHGFELQTQFDLFGKRKVDCFACGATANIERCHIKAKNEAGNDGVENLHLLCKSCHVDSEMLSGERYWIWLKNMIDKVWQPFTEHIHTKRLRLGFDETKLMEIFVKGGIEEALNYMSFFEADNKDDVENFKKEIKLKIEEYQKKLEKNAKD
jgi:hypothetical protein